jgi:hypothetical protein
VKNGGRSFRYQERTKEDLRERANMRGGNFDSIIKSQYKLYKVKDGKNLVRIMPPTWEKPRHYGFDIFVNYNIGADNQSYLSLSKMKNKADPIAEARLVAQKEDDEKLTKALSPTHRILMWVIDRMDEDEGPLLWAAPFTVDKAFANLAFDEDTKEVIFIDDPDAGCDVRFHKEGSAMLTKYDASKMKLMAASPLHENEKLQNQWLDYITENPVPDCLQFYDYEHISEVFNGKAPAKPAEEDDPPPRRTTARVKVEEELPFDVDPETEPPRRSRPRVQEEDESESDKSPPPRESIKDRIARRRAEAAAESEEE